MGPGCAYFNLFGGHKVLLCPEISRAARGLLDWTQEDLAMRAGVSRSTVRDFEKGRHVLHRSSEDLLVAALRSAGVELMPAGEGGPGVRLLTHAETKPCAT
nr:helix-turn-helix domain-containing protein [Alsobacter metallidurans]